MDFPQYRNCCYAIKIVVDTWAPIEIKRGVDGIEAGAKNLLKLRDRVNTDSLGEPSFMMVLTSVGTAYRRDDGVWVVPIVCLGP